MNRRSLLALVPVALAARSKQEGRPVPVDMRTINAAVLAHNQFTDAMQLYISRLDRGVTDIDLWRRSEQAREHAQAAWDAMR